MKTQSAGILVYCHTDNEVEVLLAHPGGPFWAKKDIWSIPKGELESGEDLLEAAKREFKEEMGFDPPIGDLLDLGQSKQPGKINYIWAVEGNPDLSKFKCSSTVTIEWPPKSGQKQVFPENDRVAWLNLSSAKTKLFKAQIDFIDRLAEKLGVEVTEPPEQVSLL